MRFRRRRYYDERPRRRRASAIWALFWLILLIVVLGLIFGGYRKGTQINNPGSWITVGSSISVGRR
jgi:cell division protein FtsW (lipid II flippase)